MLKFLPCVLMALVLVGCESTEGLVKEQELLATL